MGQFPVCPLFDRDWRIVVGPHPVAAFRCDSSIVLVVLSLPANEWAFRTTLVLNIRVRPLPCIPDNK